jgi:hypothetical protein
LHSSKEIIQENQGSADWSRKMNWIADPKFDFYKKVGAEEQSVGYLLNLRGWARILGRGEHRTGLKQDTGANKETILQRPMEILVGNF